MVKTRGGARYAEKVEKMVGKAAGIKQKAGILPSGWITCRPENSAMMWVSAVVDNHELLQ
jgi:hypothetical protein